MQLRQLFDDDRAVSPVIGVILMVAITVILAAVIGTFVLGLGDQIQTTTPTASFETDFTDDPSGNDTLDITHAGGDSIEEGKLSASVSGATDESGADATYDGTLYGSSTDKVTAGTTDTIDTADFSGTTNPLDLNGATVRVVWSGEDGDSSSVLAKWSGPDA